MKVGAYLLGFALLVGGCAATRAGHMPDDTSADDRETIVTHAYRYWTDREEPQPAPSIVDDGAQYNRGVIETVLAFRQACQDKSEFFIMHGGRKERYGCLDISRHSNIDIDWSRLRQKWGNDDHVFETN